MSASVENESEILLGNKQLLVVFAVVAVLLAVAFTGGYMLGKNAGEKKPEAFQTAATEASGGPITQKIAPDESAAAKLDSKVPDVPVELSKPDTGSVPEASGGAPEPVILGQHNPAGLKAAGPKAGQSFVQVAAVARKDAEGIADVLRQHNFAARIAPAPADASLFRVLVGPAKDASDLRNTQDALRKIGYTKCFVQHY